QIQSQENQRQAEDIRQQLLDKDNSIGKPFYGEKELPLSESLHPKAKGSILNVEPKRDTFTLSEKDMFDAEAEKVLPQGSANEKMVYADVLRKNDDKIKTSVFSQVASSVDDDKFKKTIGFEDLTKRFVAKNEQQQNRRNLVGNFSPKVSLSNEIIDYANSAEFKAKVIKKANGRPEMMKQAANEVLDAKKYEILGAPSRWAGTTQKFAQYLNDEGGVIGKAVNVPLSFASGSVEGLVDISAFLGSLANTSTQVLSNEISGKPYNVSDVFSEKNKAAQDLSIGMKPSTSVANANPYAGFVNDVSSSVGYLTSAGGVLKPITTFSKIKNALAFGKASKGITQADLIGAKLAGKTVTEGNKTLGAFSKALQGKPAEFVANVLDNTAHNSVIMFSPTFQANIEKYKEMGFSDESAQQRAYGATFANMLALSLPNAVHAAKPSLIKRVLQKEDKLLVAKQSLTQARNFTRDMTLLRLYESNRDREAMIDEGINYNSKQLDQQLGEQLAHAKNDAFIGGILGLKAGMRYKGSQMQAQAIVEAMQDPSMMTASIRDGIAKGTISKETAKSAQDFLTTIQPHYLQTIAETRKDGKPKYTPQDAVQVAIEKTKISQAKAEFERLNAETETGTITETDKDGNIKERTVFRHPDGKMYTYEFAPIKNKKAVLASMMSQSMNDIRQIENGQYVKGKLVSADEMIAIAQSNSLNGKLKPNQAKEIAESGPFEAVEINANDFAEQPEIAKKVNDIKEGKAELPDLTNVASNDAVLNSEGKVVEGRKRVAHAIVRGGGKITFMKPIETERLAEVASESYETKIGETEPNVEGMSENEAIGVKAIADVFNATLEANEGNVFDALTNAVIEAKERFVEPQSVIDAIQKAKGEGTFSTPIIEGAIREANRIIAARESSNKDQSIADKMRQNAKAREVVPQEAPKEGGEGVGGDVEIKNEGKADAPTEKNVQERLNINNPFYKKVNDVLVKLGLIEKYNPETGTGDIIGGVAQPLSGKGGFAVGDMYFYPDGSISYVSARVTVQFDKKGNVIYENTKETDAQ
ncbi:MAG: hypothetical protein IT256_08775, partial [Chitinophagaceae bacterium]|nr:hypothetical protein [Chitinophagaceae bacterium]